MEIRKQDALADMEIHDTPSGARNIFSIKFIKKDGELVYLPYAYSSGLRADMKNNRLRGVTPCTSTGQATGHPYPVIIDNIIGYNNNIVMP